MSVGEHFTKLGKVFGVAINKLHDFAEAIKDCDRMQNARIELAKVSSIYFLAAFDNIAMLICGARIAKTADTYCSLVETAVTMLAKGEAEKDVLYYFDKLYVKEMAGED